jgi:hypothetical protein
VTDCDDIVPSMLYEWHQEWHRPSAPSSAQKANAPYEPAALSAVSSMRLLAKQAIIVGMAANPEPDESIGGVDGQGSVVGADPSRPEPTDFLKVE